MKNPIQLLLWIGIVKVGRKNTECQFVDGGHVYLYPEKIIWPLSFAPWWMWRHPVACARVGGWFYVFRNQPGVIKWREGRLLPIRWGFGIMGGLIEFGDRGSGIKINLHRFNLCI